MEGTGTGTVYLSPPFFAPGTWYIQVTGQGLATYTLASENITLYPRPPWEMPAAGAVVTTPGLAPVANLIEPVVRQFEINGGILSDQKLAAGDWRFYRVQVPDPAPASWSFTYAVTSGDVDVFVRDTAPPGMATLADQSRDAWNTPIYIYDWSNPGYGSSNLGEVKNQGPYLTYPNPGTHTIATPPLRPGAVYYLGFRASTGATFNVSSTINGSTVAPPAISFYGGSVGNVSVPAGGNVVYRIDVPDDAARWKHTATASDALDWFLEEGTRVDLLSSASPHRRFEALASWAFDQPLSGVGWPWLPGKTFYLTVRNRAATPRTFSLTMDG